MTKKSIFRDTFVRNLIFVTLIVFLIEILFRAIENFELFDYANIPDYYKTRKNNYEKEKDNDDYGLLL